MLNLKIRKTNWLVLLIIAGCQLAGCHERKNENSFYSTTKSADLWRFPLIKPYELISPTNSGDWFLNLKLDSSQLHKDFFYQGSDFQVSDIESLGIKDSIIVIYCNNLYWPKLGGLYSSTIFIDCPTNQVLVFSNEHHSNAINQMLAIKNLKDIRLYQVENIVKQFQATQKRPAEWTE